MTSIDELDGIREIDGYYDRDGDVAGVRWPLWGTGARIVVTDPNLLSEARVLVTDYLDQVELACSRFREDSEITALARAHGKPVEVSALLAGLIRDALSAAEHTDGDVDPTVGAALAACGYDRDFALIADADTPVRAAVVRPACWSMVTMTGRMVTVPDGVHLDLGATAKASTADHCAELVAATLGCGVLVSLGGDIATGGAPPERGWQVRVQDGAGEPGCQITLPAGGALATSSTRRRRWTRGGHSLHHILDPHTGWPAEPAWRTVSVAAGSCLAANTVSTAAIVRGRTAADWITGLGLPARLVGQDLRVRTLAGWPDAPPRAA